MDKPKYISREDLLMIQNANANINYFKVQVENAELMKRNLVLLTYMKYSLTANDGINFQNGQITTGATDLDQEFAKQEEERKNLISEKSSEKKGKTNEPK